MTSETEAGEFAAKFKEAFGPDDEFKKALTTLERAFGNTPYREMYMRHNIGVAAIAMKLHLEKNTVLTALLHNVIEYGISSKEIENEFGNDVLELIDSKARFEKALSFNSGEKELAAKKLHIVLTTNPASVMLQFSEALDKLHHIDEVPEPEREKFLEEVKEVYTPLAHKLNIYSLSSELNDLSFKFEHAQAYKGIENGIRKIARQAAQETEKTRLKIADELEKAGIEADIKARLKTVYSTYAKMNRKKVGLRQIYDLIALRVITHSIKECYESLGIVHTLWKPIPGEFDDYIAKPKENGYKSLHTSVYTDEGVPIEIQIRTKEMDDFAELGIASHWRYKGGKKDSKYDSKIEWIKQILEWERESGKSTRGGISGKEVFALTPTGELIVLPDGSTVIDFAYEVHSDIGDKCQGAKINGTMVSLNTRIKNGDIVEIITTPKQTPKVNWLTFARTGKAKQKIMAKLNLKKSKEKTRSVKLSNYVRTNNSRVRIAKCCSPLPGDEIIGIKTTKRKISVHRSNCGEAGKPGATKINAQWDEKSHYYDAEIVAEAENRIGIIKDILQALTQNKIQVESTNVKAITSDTTMCAFEVKLKNIDQLGGIIKKLANVKGVKKAYRK